MVYFIRLITLLFGVIFVVIYLIRSCKGRCDLNFGFLCMSFLYGTGTISGILLIASLVNEKILDLVPERSTYIALGGVAIIGLSITEMIKFLGIIIPKSKSSEK